MNQIKRFQGFVFSPTNVLIKKTTMCAVVTLLCKKFFFIFYIFCINVRSCERNLCGWSKVLVLKKYLKSMDETMVFKNNVKAFFFFFFFHFFIIFFRFVFVFAQTQNCFFFHTSSLNKFRFLFFFEFFLLLLLFRVALFFFLLFLFDRFFSSFQFNKKGF